MPYKIGIIGAGWYGCHLASSLASLGFDVRVYDRHEELMQEASGNNQFRLHLGFHYARHHGTRLQSRDGFQRFIERYPTLSDEIEQNVYAVPNTTSLVDYSTYKLVMAASGIDYIEMPEPPAILTDVEGCLLTRERVIMLDRARRMFRSRLAGSLELGTEARVTAQGDRYAEINGERFDYVIDATWGQLKSLPIEVYYEPTLLLYYEASERLPAITLVDGPLASIYPTEDRSIYTLSSVPHTPLGRYGTAGEAHAARAAVDSALVGRKRALMEEQISQNVPAFRDLYRFAGVQLAIKTKPVGYFDDRSCTVYQDGRVFSVMSGKIDTIFFAVERVLSLIEADNEEDAADLTPSPLRRSILNPA